MVTSLALFVSLCLASSSFANANVINLTADNFDEVTSGKSIFVKFFAPWCGNCRAMEEDWEKLAEDWKDHKVGLVAEVDCTTDEGQPLCEDFEVQGFPTLLYGDPTSPETYEGGREYEEMAEFAEKHISFPICSVFRIENCSPDQKAVIAELQAKSEEELEKIASAVEEEVQAAEQIFDKDVEELQQKYDALVQTFNDKLDKIKEEKNYKFIEQILAKNQTDDEDGYGAEL